MGTFKLIISDVLLLFLTVYVLVTGHQFKKAPSNKVKGFIIFTLAYFFACFLSIINAVDLPKFFNAQLPSMFMFLLLFVSYKIIAADPETFMKKLRKTIVWVLIFINTPAYISLMGLRLSMWFDPARYQGFTYNPNQFVSYVLIAVFLLIILDIKLKKGTKTVTLLMLYSVVPVLLSGSKTGILILLLLIVYYVMQIFIRISLMKKVLFVLGMFLVIQVASPFFESFRKTNWSVDRAVKTYDIVMGNEKVDRSTETRFTQADFGKELLKEHPALGVGLGNFVVYFEDNEVHNSFLSTLYECGILGFTFLILLVLYILMALLVSKYPRRYIAAAVFTFLLFMGMNTFHIYFRERWVWFYFICLMFLFSQPKIDTPIIKSETI